MRILPHPVCRCFAALVLVLASLSASGAEAERRYGLNEHGFLQMTVPQGWLDEVRERAPAPPTIVYRPLEGDAFLVLVTPIWRPRPDVPLPGKEALRKRVELGLERARAQAVEKEIRVREFAGASGPGFYYSATDRAPKPGEFTYLTQGMLRVGELVVTFTLLSNSGQDALLEHTLRMLQNAAQLQK